MAGKADLTARRPARGDKEAKTLSKAICPNLTIELANSAVTPPKRAKPASGGRTERRATTDAQDSKKVPGTYTEG